MKFHINPKGFTGNIPRMVEIDFILANITVEGFNSQKWLILSWKVSRT